MDQLIENLRAVVGRDALLSEPDELLVYECDGLPQHKHRPRAVVFPHSTEVVAEVLRLLAREGVSFSPRGAGTGLSGGALALSRGVIIELARMRRVLKIDADNRRAVVQTGLVNAQLSRAAAPFRLHYAPDPSSQASCTIGGNIAENAGGIHCLKYGTTVDHVLSARVVLAGGEIVELDMGAPGYDLLGVFVGSEGTFGIATEATLKLLPIPPAVRTVLAIFADVDDASRAVSQIIAAGIVPAALEMMDGAIIRAVEASVFAAGIPLDAEAALLVELDGLAAGLDEEAARAENICRQHNARSVRRAADEQERKKLWAARKGAFGAMGRISPDTMIQDAVVPRSRLPEVLAATYRIGAKYSLRVANVFHAGDGNLHPFICFDARHADEVERVKEASREVMETCVRAGGSITGEHGVGFDKSAYLPLIFSDDDMDTMLRVRAAFDPTGLCNPGKIIPTSRSCGEARGAATRRGTMERGDAEELPRGDIAQRSSTLHSSDSGGAIDTGQLFPASTRQRVSVSPTSASQSAAILNRNPFNIDTAHEALASIVGTAHVAMSTSTRVSASPVITVAPANADEACAVLRQAISKNWAVVLAGAGTWLDVGQPLPRVDIILQTNRMQRIIEHEPADLVASAEAGVTLARFNDELNRAGQWLPLDPPNDGNATLGGIASTGIAGAQSFGYGLPRGFVIGMRVALADGRVIKAGGRVVKNVAGYDLCKLFTGSYGTLGLILELTFKLRPLPTQAATIIATGPLKSLWRVARSLLKAHLFPVALELLSAHAADRLNVPVENENEGALLIRFAGGTEAVAAQIKQTLPLLEHEREIKRGTALYDDEALWHALSALPAQSCDQLIWRAQVPPVELGSLLETETNAPSTPVPSGTCWHMGVGDGRLRVIGPLATPISDSIKVLEEWRTRVQQFGGWMIVEDAPREIKSVFDVWGDVGAAAPLMQRIKQQLDPRNILSPGRFVAEI